MSEEARIWPAARSAAELVESGMVAGLGTGRAAAMFVRALAERIVQEGLSVRGIPTSDRTTKLAEELSIPLTSLDEVERVDIDVDGADEVDPNLDLIKGHGGALLRERVVASVSERFVVLVGDEKLVVHLGERVSVPVEVVPFAAPVARRELASLGSAVELRTVNGVPYRSDNGNYILDVRFERIPSPAELEKRIDNLPGVVDSGLFIGMADLVLVQSDGSFRTVERS
jgi:ribose 5-phosphate isomerase A